MLIEITLFRIAKRGENPIVEKSVTPPTPKKIIESVPKAPSISALPKDTRAIPAEETIIAKIEEPPTVAVEEVKKEMETSDAKSFSFPLLVAKLKESNPALTVDLKSARFNTEGTKLTLIFSKNWNFERVNVSKVRNLIADTCQSTFGGDWEVQCELKE